MITRKNKPHPSLFRAPPSPELQVLAWLLLCWCLFYIDTHHPLHQLRHTLSWITHPLERAIDGPMVRIGWLLDTFYYHQDVIKENEALKSEVLRLQNAIQQMQAMQRENRQLRALLHSKPLLGQNQVVMAQLLAVRSHAWSPYLVVNHGEQQGIEVGQVAMDALGVVGQVVDVYPNSSLIMPVSDPKSAVLVQSIRNGLRGVAVGTGKSDHLALINMSNHVDVEVGDLFVTSGLGERYPYGYPVGQVVEVNRDQGHGFAEIILKTSAQLNRSRLVLLMKHRSAA